ncbi:uncharacterized protein LOC108845119 [Raphanus sativus]|uniref:Uncharacterized protein LOC108845119 n=1 Tax=Raphanus sativus TaxID=3726 RepID=A0A6J0MN38_RAPSA|nr:uncharacterized protein LOC108845119 [Raphanus sativus]
MQTSQQASGGESSSFVNNENIGNTGPPCRCGRSTKLLKAWTDENPGRRFFCCGVHGFSSWSDAEEPHGWQMTSLLEARDQIERQRSEIHKLKSEIRVLRRRRTPPPAGSEDNLDCTRAGADQSEEYNQLESEVLKVSERERVLRQVLLISWGGFLAATAIIISMTKK